MTVELGVPLVVDKTVGPTTKLAFLGIELDMVSAVPRPPREAIVAPRHDHNNEG